MTTIPTKVARLYGTTAAGAVSAEVAPCELLGNPRRTVGLWGDALAVKIAHDNVGSDWDLNGEFLLEIGDELDAVPNTITLGGYYLRQRRQVEWGDDPANPGNPAFFGVVLGFTTLPGVLRDGRGGVLTEGTLNITDATGRVDTGHAGYHTTQQLVDLCLDALGVAHDACPAGINTPVDGSTTIHGPGPLDWGLTRALPELEDLLARVGWTATLVNDGSKVAVHRLRRSGEPITLPTIITLNAEPYSLETAVGVRPSKIVVTSGRTRSTIITDRSIGGTLALEWVAFDSRSGAWLNGTEWVALYATETGPGDLAAFQAGPGGVDRSAEDMRAFSRLFTAVRLHADDRPSAARFVTPAEGVEPAAGVLLARTPAVAVGRYCVAEGGGVYLNEPTGAGVVRLDKVQAIPGDGVFVLPSDVAWVRMSPGPKGGHADADELASGDLTIYFAHEADSGDWTIDYYASGWEVQTGVAEVGVAQMSPSELADAIADPTVVKIEVPWLRRLLDWPEADASPTALNDTALDAVAEQLALTRIGGAALTTGSIDLAGIHDVEPGAADGAVSAVEWDLERMRTICSINTHETPSGFYDNLEAAARRSVGAGLGRFSLAGSSAGASSPRSGSTPGDQTVGASSAGGTATPESQPGSRGRDRAAAGRPAQTQPDSQGGRGSATRAEVSMRWVEIIDWASVGVNRWRYSWREVAWSGGAWSPVTGGAVYTTHGYAYNGIEVPNDGLDFEGNGVDLDNLVGTFAVVPIGTGVIVPIWGPFSDGAGANVYWFTAVNAIDGVCEVAS
jgi:hypothetical protein